jgi:HSP20 family protein
VLPGVQPDDLTIDFVDSVLTIKATRRAPEASEGQSYHLRELSDAQYERSLRFPVQINADAISANYEHGVLTLSLPKAEEVKPRRINVQAVS